MFSFVRNPYDRALSHWAFCRDNHKYGVTRATTFLGYCEKTMQHVFNHKPQVAFLQDYSFDFIGHFENFEEDVRTLASLLGDTIGEVPKLNTSDRPPYQKGYCKRSKGIVERWYAEDFKKLGYKKEDF